MKVERIYGVPRVNNKSKNSKKEFVSEKEKNGNKYKIIETFINNQLVSRVYLINECIVDKLDFAQYLEKGITPKDDLTNKRGFISRT